MVGELEQYSYSITHDMRAPLRAMAMFSQLLLADHAAKLDETGRDYLQRIDSAAKRLDHLIQDVLSHSRLSRAELTLEPVNLDQLLRETIQQYPNLQSVKAHIEIQGPLLAVLGNPTALVQCVSNLLGNAVKFVAPGTRPQIKIYSEPCEGQVRVWVADNGIGIAPDLLGRVWGIFQRGHANKAYEGTGIGLSIVKKAVGRMGGKVGVESELGQGSRFWFQLPRAG
jgi:signal transduction histidine kinase